jgi:hypothetical protein
MSICILSFSTRGLVDCAELAPSGGTEGQFEAPSGDTEGQLSNFTLPFFTISEEICPISRQGGYVGQLPAELEPSGDTEGQLSILSRTPSLVP